MHLGKKVNCIPHTCLQFDAFWSCILPHWRLTNWLHSEWHVMSLGWNSRRQVLTPMLSYMHLRNTVQVDWGCERSGCADTGAAIARALGLNYIFVCEFQELHSPLRDARSQGGGVHGNAILSK
jgi:hypothetical protein